MSNLILLIQSEADVAALPSAAQSIISHGYKGCWILVSPAIAVNASEASAKYDKEIADLRTAERAAAERGDYTAASEHKLAREGKELERGTAVAGAWKAVNESDRMNAIKNKLAPLMAAFPGKLNTKTQVLQDHYDLGQWVQMLNSLSGAWFKEFTPGSFSVAWPGAIPAMGVKIPIVQEKNALVVTLDKNLNIVDPKPEAKPQAAPKTTKTAVVAATNPDDRMAQLMSMKTFGLYGIAKGLGVEFQKRSKNEIAADIVAKEFAVTA